MILGLRYLAAGAGPHPTAVIFDWGRFAVRGCNLK